MATKSTKNPYKIRNKSVTNKVSSTVIQLSKIAGLGISLSPGSFGGLRRARGKALMYQSIGRDINSLAKGKVIARVSNRIKGRIGGLAVNAALPNTNNLILRIARGQIGKYMNKKIHSKTKKLNMLEVFGGKATRQVHKQILSPNKGKIFEMMQDHLAMSLQALAPRTEFTMNIGGTIVQFGPNNLADSVQKLEVQLKPEENVLAKWAVTVGSKDKSSTVADQAPYVWIANYGGVLFNPQEPMKGKNYAPTFFAERSLEFVERTYKPIMKKMYETFLPKKLSEYKEKNKMLDPSKLMSRSYGETHKRLQKIWLSKDGEALKKQVEMEKKGRGKKMSTSYQASDKAGEQDFTEYYKKYFGNTDLGDGKMFVDAVDDGAMAAMRIMYGDETFERTTVKETLKKTKPTNRRRTRVKEEIVEEIPYRITSGTGRVPIYADMRELKNRNGKFMAGRGNRYKNTVIEPAKVDIQSNYRFSIGEVALDSEEVIKIFDELKRNGLIKYVHNKKTGAFEVEVLDVDKVAKKLNLEGMGGATGDPNLLAAQAKGYASVDDYMADLGKNIAAGGTGGLGSSISGAYGGQSKTRGVVRSAEQKAVQAAEEAAMKEIVDELNAALPAISSTRKIQVGPQRRKTGKTNREHFESLTDPQQRRFFKQQLRQQTMKDGKKVRTLNSVMDEPLYKEIPGYERTIANTRGRFRLERDAAGQLKIVSDLDEQIPSLEKTIKGLDDNIKALKDKKQGLIDTKKDLGTPAKALQNLDDKGILKNWKSKGFVPGEDGYMYKLQDIKAQADVDIPGYGKVKKGQKMPKQTGTRVEDLVGKTKAAKLDGARVASVGGKAPVGGATLSLDNEIKNVNAQIKELEDLAKPLKKQVRDLKIIKKREEALIYGGGQNTVTFQGTTLPAGALNTLGGRVNARLNKKVNNAVPKVLKKNINVQGTSSVLKGRGGIISKDKFDIDAFNSLATGTSKPPTITFFFKDEINQQKARKRGLFAYEAKVSRPKVGGGHHSPTRTIRPQVSRVDKAGNILDLTFTDPSLPTSKLVIRQRFTGKGQSTRAEYLGPGGTKLNKVQRINTNSSVQGVQNTVNRGIIDDLAFLGMATGTGKQIEQPRSKPSGGFNTAYTDQGIVLRFEDR